MTYYQREIRVPRLKALRRLLTRRGLVLTLRIETDGSVVATVDTNAPTRPVPRWHRPSETWRTSR